MVCLYDTWYDDKWISNWRVCRFIVPFVVAYQFLSYRSKSCVGCTHCAQRGRKWRQCTCAHTFLLRGMCFHQTMDVSLRNFHVYVRVLKFSYSWKLFAALLYTINTKSLVRCDLASKLCHWSFSSKFFVRYMFKNVSFLNLAKDNEKFEEHRQVSVTR